MKRVPVRSFQLKPYEFLKELPIMLTRYGKDVAVLDRAKKTVEVPMTQPDPVTVELPKPVEIAPDPRPKFSDTKRDGYKFVPMLNKWMLE